MRSLTLEAPLLKQFQVRVSPGEGKAAIREAEEVVLLVVDEAREPFLAEEHLYLVEGFGLSASELCGGYGTLLASHWAPVA